MNRKSISPNWIPKCLNYIIWLVKQLRKLCIELVYHIKPMFEKINQIPNQQDIWNINHAFGKMPSNIYRPITVYIMDIWLELYNICLLFIRPIYYMLINMNSRNMLSCITSKQEVHCCSMYWVHGMTTWCWKRLLHKVNIVAEFMVLNVFLSLYIKLVQFWLSLYH